MEGAPILFTVDECLPERTVRQILERHIVHVMDLGTKDPAILVAAEEDGAIIASPDNWFDRQLRRMPYYDKQRYTRAGVVSIPGEWEDAESVLRRWLPVVEAVYRVTRGEADERVVVEPRKNGAVYIDP